MSLKKQRILKTIIFTLIGIGLFVYSIFIFVPRKLKPSEATRFYRGMGYRDEPKDSLDAMIIGTSDAFSCFSPSYIFEKHGLKTYNCGVSKQSVLGMRKQLEDILKYLEVILKGRQISDNEWTISDEIPFSKEQNMNRIAEKEKIFDTCHTFFLAFR